MTYLTYRISKADLTEQIELFCHSHTSLTCPGVKKRSPQHPPIIWITTLWEYSLANSWIRTFIANTSICPFVQSDHPFSLATTKSMVSLFCHHYPTATYQLVNPSSIALQHDYPLPGAVLFLDTLTMHPHPPHWIPNPHFRVVLI